MMTSVQKDRIDHYRFKALGTEIKIFLVLDGPEKEKKKDRYLEEVEKIYREKEKILSRFDQESELSRINSQLGIFQEASDDILYLVQKSLEFNELSQRFFDPRILEILENVGYKNDFKTNNFKNYKIDENISFSDRNLEDDLKIDGKRVWFGKKMDFSGIAKGYITDIVAKYLKNDGWGNFLIDSGGDIRAHGKDENGEIWRVDIEGAGENRLLLQLDDLSVATSGITRRKWEIGEKRYHHLVNPAAPYEFDFGLKSVTVIDKSCERADILAKTLYLMGRSYGLEYSKKENIRSIFLDYRGGAYLSKNVKSIIL